MQPSPDGLAQAFILAEEFLAGGPACLILGDNIFYAEGLSRRLQAVASERPAARSSPTWCKIPNATGSSRSTPTAGRSASRRSRPSRSRTIAATGLYFFDRDVVEHRAAASGPRRAANWKSPTSSRAYLERGDLHVEILGRGSAWLDTGTHQSLLDAGQFIRVIEERQSLKIACPEEIAWRMGFIDDTQLRALAAPLRNSGYGEYLLQLLEGRR